MNVSRRTALGLLARRRRSRWQRLACPAARGRPPTRPQMLEILKVVDDRQRNQGDWRSLAYIENKERGKVDVIYEALFFRRSEDQKFMFLFTKPKASQGQGYLRIDKNLWFYDPSVGKWERRTERERIGGTNSRRSDFDESRLAQEYDPEFVAEEKLGAYTAIVMNLKGKPGIDLAFPVIKLWVDKDTNNVLKRQEFALSGKLLRTSYYPKWKKVYSESRKADIWYPAGDPHLRRGGEGQPDADPDQDAWICKPLEPNMFTKAWLESKSR